MDIKGAIYMAQRVRTPSGGFCLRGVLCANPEQQITEDTYITTSKVSEEVEPNVFHTQNSAYRVMTWLSPSKPTSAYTPEEIASWNQAMTSHQKQ